MRIDQKNLKDYLKKTYGGNPVRQHQKILDNFTPLLQKNYGGAGDCTLTSMTAIVNFLSKGKYQIQDIYNCVEKYALKYFYTGETGTPTITTRKIFEEVSKVYKLSKPIAKYGKELGYTFDIIKQQISYNNPLILSINDDGKNYYKNHSITVVGFEVWKVGNKEIKMIAIYDNWYSSISYVDYDKISYISTIHYLKPGLIKIMTPSAKLLSNMPWNKKTTKKGTNPKKK